MSSQQAGAKSSSGGGPAFNIITVGYLFSRLSPFIIVCYFVLQSLFNMNLKVIFYLAGILLTCFVSSIILPKLITGTSNPEEVCNAIPGMPNISMGQSILGFTFAYLCFIITRYKMWATNIFTALIFPGLILFDFIWNYKHSCAGIPKLASSLAFGLLAGYVWASIIQRIDPELQFFNGISNKAVCSRPTKTLYSCAVKFN